ncbi:MAG: hypothetical protein JJE45_01770 [Prolixibacteraceae bacterium]|nr:hypothetical protein [Prolixibacteraceae bacterium]
MKNSKFLLFVAIILLSVSCQQKKITKMQNSQDSIYKVMVQKDSTILDFVSTMNEIQMNMDSIKELQNIVRMDTGSGSEMGVDKKQRIISDISILNEILQENMKKVAELQKKLNASNMKNSALQKSVYILQKQISEKEKEIVLLKGVVSKLNIDVSNLNTELKTAVSVNDDKDKIITTKNEKINNQIVALNTAYYVFGSSRELMDHNIIEKKNGVLGLGRTLVMSKDFDRNYFTKIDIRNLKTIQLFVKKAKIVTVHPEDSYHFIKGDKDIIDNLSIDNPKEFWKTNKYLVIVIN